MEEEEDVQKRKVAIVAAAHAAAASAMASAYMLTNIPKEPYIDRNDDRRRFMQSILKNDRKCRHNLRMGAETFYRLCELIRRQGRIDDSENCTLEEMLMRFLHMIGHNVRHRVIEGRFYRSGETISRQFNEVLDCVINLYGPLVGNHLEEVHRSGTPLEITHDPHFASYFKDCLGALDGTHIVANVPIEEQDKYRGRKLIPTQNVLAACSFDLKFTYVLVGWEGTAHDQRVLDDALTRPNPFVVPRGKYYLVDGGYTHQPGFLAPYRGVSYHLVSTKGRTPLNEKEIFNKRHAHLRNAIERAFGVLKKRWTILSNEAFYPYKTQVKIALACFVLHNHIMGVDPDDSFLREVDKELENATPEDVDEPPQSSFTSQKAAWVQFRSDLAHKMFVDYKNHRNV